MSLRIEHLEHRYGPIRSLAGVSVSAEAGRVVAVLGPNAAGKSTLLRCVIGALKPLRGRVIVDGRPAHRLSARELARSVAYVPQRSIVSAAFTVREVVELGRYALPPDRRRVDEALRRLELDDLGARRFAALSVGQQQRVTLARALAQLGAGGHLVLDEPASGMDLGHVRSTIGLLREVAARGVVVLLAVHDLSMAAAVADDAWILREGALVAAGPARDVLTPAHLEPVFGVAFRHVDGTLVACL